MAVEGIDLLLVEDNPNDLELTLHALKSFKLERRIQIVRDGVEVLEYLFGQSTASDSIPLVHPRVIWMDIKLPRMDGLDVLERIKSNPHTREIPVVMLTSSSILDDIERAYRVGANSFIIKPIEYQDFSDTVKTLGKYWLSLNVVNI